MKAVFFDIDGTLIGSDGRVPESVATSIKQLRARGNLAFLCSGRTKVQVHDPLLAGIDFDGVISGSGTLIEYRDEVLFYRTIPADLATRSLETFKANKVRPILEGRDCFYFDEDDLPIKNFKADIKAALSDKIFSVAENAGKWKFSKFICLTDPAVSNVKSCVKSLEDNFNFQIHNDYVFEMILKDVNKGTAIKFLCRKLGIDLADTFAIGDSLNDLDMLQTVGTAIAMANAPDTVKNAADFVTELAEDDGIFVALKHFNLIDG